MRVLPNGRGPVRSARVVVRYSPSTHILVSCNPHGTAGSVTRPQQPTIRRPTTNTVVQATVSHAADEYIDFVGVVRTRASHVAEVIEDDVLGPAAQLSVLLLWPLLVIVCSQSRAFFSLEHYRRRRPLSALFVSPQVLEVIKQMRRLANNETGGLHRGGSPCTCSASSSVLAISSQFQSCVDAPCECGFRNGIRNRSSLLSAALKSLHVQGSVVIGASESSAGRLALRVRYRYTGVPLMGIPLYGSSLTRGVAA